MSRFDFDQPIDRTGTNAVKIEMLKKLYGRTDLMPLWVADMEFATPHFITEALQERLSHSLYGYTVEPPDYWPTVLQWIETLHGWKVDQEWITFIPGILRGIGMAINLLVKEDEKIIIQPPVYYPFYHLPKDNGRELVYNPLRECNGGYEMDFEQLANVVDEKCRMLILSNPHNPAGVVWSEYTLRQLASFCYAHNIIVISDEIHSDMALWDNRHIPFATVSDEAAACSITFGSPSKTFNLAGIVSSYAIVPNPTLRHTFYHWLTANEFNKPNIFSPIATIAAYKYGEVWRHEMLNYVEQNINTVIDYCAAHIPQLKVWKPQASFLVWLDCRPLKLTPDELSRLFIEEAKLALNTGASFGKEGEGFMRMNVALPRQQLLQALSQLQCAVDNLVR